MRTFRGWIMLFIAFLIQCPNVSSITKNSHESYNPDEFLIQRRNVAMDDADSIMRLNEVKEESLGGVIIRSKKNPIKIHYNSLSADDVEVDSDVSMSKPQQDQVFDDRNRRSYRNGDEKEIIEEKLGVNDEFEFSNFKMKKSKNYFNIDLLPKTRETSENYPVSEMLASQHPKKESLAKKSETLILKKVEQLPIYLNVHSSVLHLISTEHRGRAFVAYSTPKNQIYFYEINMDGKADEVTNIPGSGPCRFMNPATDLLMACSTLAKTKKGELRNQITIFSILDDTQNHRRPNLKRLQVVNPPGVIVGFDSWRQGSSYYFSVNCLSKNSYETELEIYEWKSDNFEKKSFDGSVIGSALNAKQSYHLQVGEKEHFLVLPNFNVDISGDTFSFILKFNFANDRYEFHQRISTNGGRYTHAVSFALQGETSSGYYLVLSKYCEIKKDFCDTTANSTIYRYQYGKFEHFQSIPTYGATALDIVKVEDEVLIVVLNSLKGISFYAFEGWEFAEVIPMSPQAYFGRGIASVTSFSMGGEKVLGVGMVDTSMQRPRTISFYKLIFEKYTNSKQLTLWCKGAHGFLVQKKQTLEYILPQIPKKNKPITFDNDLEVQSMVFEQAQEVPIRDTKMYLDLKSRIDFMNTEFEEIDNLITTIHGQISQSIDINKTSSWTANLKYRDVVILRAKVDDLYAQSIDGEAVPSEDSLVPLRHLNSQLDLETKTFTNIKLTNLSLETLLGHPLDSFVTLNRDHHLKGHIVFNEIKVPTLDVGGLIGGVNMSTEEVLVRAHRDQKLKQNFKGSMKCRKLIASNLETSFINDVEVKKLIRDTPLKDTAVVISGNLTIVGDLTYPGDLSVGSLGGLNISELENSVLDLKTQSKQVINGKFHSNFAKMNRLQVRGSLNDVPYEDLFINLPEKVYHEKSVFFHDFRARKIKVKKQLNDIKVVNEELDVLTLHGDQNVTARKTFHHIHLKDQDTFLPAASSAEMLNDEQWKAKSRRLLIDNKETLNTIDKQREYLQTIRNSLQTLHLVEIYLIELKTLMRTNTPIESISIEGSFDEYETSLDNLLDHAETLRGIVMKSDTSSINIFSRDFDEKNTKNLEKVYDLPQISYKMKDKLIKLSDSLDNLIRHIETKIGSKNQDIEKLEIDIDMEKKKIGIKYSKFDIIEYVTKGTKVAGRVSGYEFRETNLDSYRKNNISAYSAMKNADQIIFLKDFRTSRINDVNMEKLFGKAIPLSSQEINVPFVLKTAAVVQGSLLSPRINDVATKDLATLSGTNFFLSPVHFKSFQVEDDIEVKGLLNSKDIKALHSRIATISGPTRQFKTKVHFKSLTTNSIKSNSVRLNDLPIDDYVTRQQKRSIIAGSKQFSSIAVLDSYVNIGHLETSIVDGISIRESLENKGTVTGNLRIREPSSKIKRLLVEKDLTVSSSLKSTSARNKIDFNQLLDAVVYKDVENVIESDLIFDGKVHVNNLIFKDTLDGVSAAQFADGFLHVDEDQTIAGKNLFTDLKVKNLIVKDHFLQDVDLRRLNNETAKIDQDCIFSDKVFFRNLRSVLPITVDGLVQGYNLSEDAVIKSKPTTFLSSKTFRGLVKVDENIKVEGRTNLFDIEEQCNSIIGTTIIDGPVQFRDTVKTRRLFSGSRRVPDRKGLYWMKNEPAVLSGNVFMQTLQTPSIEVKEELNDIRVPSIMKDSISCNKSILGKWSIRNARAKNIKAKSIHINFLDSEPGKLLHMIIINGTDQVFKENLEVQELGIEGEFIVKGKINGHDALDFCLKNEKCTITAQKKFLNGVTVTKDWIIKDRWKINDMKVSFIKSLDKLAPVDVIIENSLHAPAIEVKGYVNTVKFDANTIMDRSGTQIMKGSLSVTNYVDIALKVKDLVTFDKRYNGLNMTPLNKTRVKRRRSGPVEEDLENSTEGERMLNAFKDLGQSVIKIRSILRDQALSFDGWKLVQEFQGPSRVTPLLNSNDAERTPVNALALILAHEVKIFVHIPKTNSFKEHPANVELNCTTDAKGFYYKNSLYFATSTSCPNPHVNTQNIIKVNPAEIKFAEPVYSYIWKVSEGGAKLYAAVATPEATGVVVFTLNRKNCFLFVSERTSDQNIICDHNGVLTLQQSIPSDHTFKVLHVAYKSSEKEDVVNLLFLANAGYYRKKIPSVEIFQFDTESQHFKHVQEIHHERLIWISVVNFDLHLYLVTVQRSFNDATDGEVLIYRASTEIGKNNSSMFVMEDTILVSNPLQASFMVTPSGELVLLVLTKGSLVKRYKKFGFETFTEEGEIYVAGKYNLETWKWAGHSDYNLALSEGSFCAKYSDRYSDSKSTSLIIRPLYKGQVHV